VVHEIAVVALVVVDGPGVLPPQLRLIEPQVGRTEEALGQVEQVGVEGQSVQAPRPPRSADDAGPLVGCQPGMSGRVGEVLLGPRVVQPQSFLGRRQLVSLEETLEGQIALLAQIRHTTVGHPHRCQKLSATQFTHSPFSTSSRTSLACRATRVPDDTTAVSPNAGSGAVATGER
jgi:hypothetical protein